MDGELRIQRAHRTNPGPRGKVKSVITKGHEGSTKEHKGADVYMRFPGG